MLKHLNFMLRARRILGYTPGPDLPADKVLSALSAALETALSPIVRQSASLRTAPTSKYSSQVISGKPGKQQAVAKAIASLDFTVSKVTTQGYLGGARLEADGRFTVVNYCGLSGVLIVTTSLAKTDVIDIS